MGGRRWVVGSDGILMGFLVFCFREREILREGYGGMLVGGEGFYGGGGRMREKVSRLFQGGEREILLDYRRQSSSVDCNTCCVYSLDNNNNKINKNSIKY
ncbi:hypothetical protein HanRHA438_Chr15g0725351 [Helianthus annuus]|nr:hypothetical protein HanRHA438_Chr15g0725351 [Helianthus annuus]